MSLLIDGRVVPVPLDLARALGWEEAAALQQLHWLLETHDRVRRIGSYVWYAATWEQWHADLPLGSTRSVRRVFKRLRDKNLVAVRRTKYSNLFAINYALVGKLEADLASTRRDVRIVVTGQSDQSGDSRVDRLDSLDPSESGQNGQSLYRGKEERQGQEEGTSPKPPSRQRQVFAHYVDVMDKRRKDPDPEELDLIARAINAFETPEEGQAMCTRAIDGCYASDFHMGRDRRDNPRGTKYNALSQILKGKRGGKTTREQIEYLAQFAGSTRQAPGFPAADDVTLRRKMQEAVAGRVNPDPTVIKRGQEAEEWLRVHGFRTVVEERGGDRQPKVTFDRLERGEAA